MDITSGIGGINREIGIVQGPLYPSERYRLSASDQTHRAVATYSYELPAGHPQLRDLDASTTSLAQAIIEGSRRLDYFLGSGHLGTTYPYSVNGFLLESPVAYYSGSGLDLKPGISAANQIAAALPVEPACLRCHMSAVQHTDAGSMNHYKGGPFLHTGITCEACHGDTSIHLRSNGKIDPIHLATLEVSRRDSICISCHLEGDTSVERAGRSVLDYKPGDSISTYLSYFIFAGKGATKRGVSEVEQFRTSICKLKSGAAMSCTSCHDPHFSPAPDQRVEYYRSKCLSCHTNTVFITKHHPEHPDCASCHMAKTGATNIPHVAWTDHRILRQPSPGPISQQTSGFAEMEPLLSPGSNSRDLALAYYQASFKVGANLQAKSYQLLKEQERALTNGPAALDALGNMAASRGDFLEARRDFEIALNSDNSDFNASINLGTLLARSGELSQAIASWMPAFACNRDIPGLAMNLALAQCRAGQTKASALTLNLALQHSPGQKQLSDLLAGLSTCRHAKSN